MKEQEIRKFVELSSMAAASKAKIDLLNNLIQQNEKEIRLRIGEPVSDTVISHWKGLQRESMKEYRDTSTKAFKASVGLTAESKARASGVKKPEMAELAALVITDAMLIQRDSSGELFYDIKDPATGLCGDIDYYIERMKKNPEFSVLFDSDIPAATSQSNTPATEINPWKKESFNLTMQGKIITADSEKAARLKREAGVN